MMAPLVQGGWVISGRGPGGGYEPDRAFDARLLDVVEATEGPSENGRWVLRDGPCPGEETCAIHEVWPEARVAEMDWLIADIEANGPAATRSEADQRPVPAFQRTSVRNCA
jgi:DNA-binding IscR family transcriptional regulator